MIVKDITDILEEFAPLHLQEDYDNSGLIVGRETQEVEGVLLAVDVTDEVLDEARAKGCNMIITHHPIVFRGMKRFNDRDLTQRCVARALREDLVLYACHTNLDAAPRGMSWRLAELLDVQACRVLEPTGVYRDEPTGFGVVGDLREACPLMDYLGLIKDRLGIEALRYTAVARETVQRVAICTGSGVSLLEQAVAAGADLYITADMKYHDAFLPDRRLTMVDIGHFESEYCAIQLINDILSKKMITFAVRKSECACNPVNYLV